jgi:hypothetical protein
MVLVCAFTSYKYFTTGKAHDMYYGRPPMMSGLWAKVQVPAEGKLTATWEAASKLFTTEGRLAYKSREGVYLNEDDICFFQRKPDRTIRRLPLYGPTS